MPGFILFAHALILKVQPLSQSHSSISVTCTRRACNGREPIHQAHRLRLHVQGEPLQNLQRFNNSKGAAARRTVQRPLDFGRALRLIGNSPS